MLKCYNCSQDLGVDAITFRTLCEKCFSGQHCCLNCRHHAIGRRNECMIPDTDFITDRAANNFCDDFQVKPIETPKETPSREDAIEKAKKLLGG